MPIYEFECSECGARFEDLVAAGTTEAPCRECGAQDARRIVSSFGVITRQPTAGQRRRMEDARGIDRGGARSRWRESMARRRRGTGRKGDGSR